MKTLKSMIDELRVLFDVSKEEIDDRTLKEWINGQRSLWLKNEINKGKEIDQSIIQTLPCMELEVVDASLCGLLRTKHRILRTVDLLPKSILNKFNNGIVSVRRPIMLDIKFNLMTREEAVYSGNGKFNSRDIFAFVYEDRVWIKLMNDNKHINFMTHIAVDGVFEDPSEAEKYTDCNNKPCFDPDKQDYPINNSMWQYMINAIYENRFNLNRDAILDPIPDAKVYNKGQ